VLTPDQGLISRARCVECECKVWCARSVRLDAVVCFERITNFVLTWVTPHVTAVVRVVTGAPGSLNPPKK
jgi:hypothetical protein